MGKLAYIPREYPGNATSVPLNGTSVGRYTPSHRRRGKKQHSMVLPVLLLLASLAAASFAGFTLFKKFSGGSGPQQNMSALAPANSENSKSNIDEIIVISADESGEALAENTSQSSVASSAATPTAIDKTDWRLVLVNPTHKLGGDYDVKLATVTGDYKLDERIVEDLKSMLAAAKKDGYTLQICSAYRSTERSRVLYQNQIAKFKKAGYSDEKAAIEAAKWVAPPGTSEHNTGLAADIVSSTYFSRHAELDHVFETYPEFTWLYSHCADYGFILRFPKDKQETTGITYEPWHYRYVGKENAKKIMDAKICLEEYLA